MSEGAYSGSHLGPESSEFLVKARHSFLCGQAGGALGDLHLGARGVDGARARAPLLGAPGRERMVSALPGDLLRDVLGQAEDVVSGVVLELVQVLVEHGGHDLHTRAC